MAKKKKRRSQYSFNPNLNTVIFALVVLALLVLCVIFVLRGCDGTPEASATPPQATATASPSPGETPTLPAEDPSASPTLPTTDGPTLDPNATRVPLQVSEGEVAAIHITIDTGYTDPDAMGGAFDDFYMIDNSNGDVDLEGINLIVYRTDSNGNSHVHCFESMDSIVTLAGFRFSAGGNTEIDEAENIQLFVDKADNCHVSWASQYAKVISTTEAEQDTVLVYTCDAGTIKLTIKNLGLLQKNEIVVY